MTDIGIGLGSNIGDAVGHVRRAVRMLESQGIAEQFVVSSLYRTAPYGPITDQEPFVNACAVASTTLSPADLLVRFKSIERQLGRRDTVHWGPRVIDLDLLFYGDLTLKTPGLTVPHEDLFNRAFVLIPLAEIAPTLTIGGVGVAQAAKTVGRREVTRIDDV